MIRISWKSSSSEPTTIVLVRVSAYPYALNRAGERKKQVNDPGLARVDSLG